MFNLIATTFNPARIQSTFVQWTTVKLHRFPMIVYYSVSSRPRHGVCPYFSGTVRTLAYGELRSLKGAARSRHQKENQTA
jgi:hypothetical protein